MLTLIGSAVLALTLVQSEAVDQVQARPLAREIDAQLLTELDQLAELQLDRDQIYRIRDVTIRRDVISVAFERGVIAFLEPVGGRVTGAVFLGSGDVLALPPDAVERGQIYKFTGSPILNEPFRIAILRFTDDTFDEVVEMVRDRAVEEVRADDLESLLPWEENLGERSYLLNHRVLADLLASEDRPFFFAGLRSDRLGWFGVTHDRRSAEEITIGSLGENVRDVPDVWASFDERSDARDPELGEPEERPDIDVVDYEIDTTIDAAARMASRTRMTVRVLRSGERVLTFGLARSLRITAASVDGRPVGFSQYSFPVADQTRDPRSDQFAVLLNEPTREGQELLLELDYAGEVLDRRGYGIYHVRDRGRWYPTLGPQEGARFTLTFHYPPSVTLVATGDSVREWEEGGMRHSSWTSEREFFLAGFNYGDFSVESDTSGQATIEVYANSSVEESYRAIEDWSALQAEQAWRSIRRSFRFSRRPGTEVAVTPDYDLFSTRRLASGVLEETRLAVEFFADRFGSYPFERLAVSQAPVGMSQGWPTLLYASTMSFFDRQALERLGFSEITDFIHPEFQRSHEIAHQWFGNKIGWQSYRDQWMIEGLSNYASLLYLEHKYGTPEPLNAFLEESRLRLLAPTPRGVVQNDNGPIWLGERLSTKDVPDGYQETVYTKATWVVHMLRMLMRDPESGSDERFFDMIREFLAEFDGRLASTRDLQRVAERYMTDRMDVSGRGDLDWFFRQWVFETGIPGYAVSWDAEPDPNGFVLSGRIDQTVDWSGVMPVPLYAVSADGAREFLGEVIVEEAGAEFRFTLGSSPARVLVDPDGAVLKLN